MSGAARILVVGRTGQLAQALANAGRPRLSFAGRPEADLSVPSSLEAAIEQAAPDAVINAGAYTSVDGAEGDAANAFAINRDGPVELARLCAARGIPMIHVSTDCVFDGRKAGAYEPGDAPVPLSVYGQSKWEGEQAVAAACPRHLIVRVSWVFSEYAGNFVKTMLTLARTRDTVTVVSDQFGYPTYCPDIAHGLLKMADAACAMGFSAYGTYHLAGDEAINRARMAELVYAESARLGGPVASVKAVPTAEYPTPAARPLNARLASHQAIETFGLTMPHWKLGLTASVRAFVGEVAAHSKPGQG
jgi:dTDP-4-dehydrorhamnose reductase